MSLQTKPESGPEAETAEEEKIAWSFDYAAASLPKENLVKYTKSRVKQLRRDVLGGKKVIPSHPQPQQDAHVEAHRAAAELARAKREYYKELRRRAPKRPDQKKPTVFVNANGHEYLCINTNTPTDELWDEICIKYEVTRDEIKSPKRHLKYKMPRFEFAWRARYELYKSTPKIGKILNRDHTTIMNACKKWEVVIAQKLANGDPL